MARPKAPGDPGRGFVVRLLGYLHHDVKQDRIDRFDLVAVGDHWGNSPYTEAPPPGARPLGIAFELTREGSPFARIPPHGARNETDYFGSSASLDAEPGSRCR